MKFLKLFLLLIAVILLGGIALSVGGWFMLRGTPDWYQPRTLTAEQRKTSEARAEAMFVNMTNWAGGARAALLRAANALEGESPTTSQAATALAHQPAAPFQIQFSDDDLTAFFDKWAGGNGRREYFDQYVQDARLILRNNQLILAGTVKEMGTVVSVQFEPRIDARGSLQLRIARVLGGILPLPDAVWARKREKIERLLESKLPAYQQSAALSSDGTANSAASAAGMNKLLLAVLRGESAEPVLFIPYDVKKLNRSVPVKITAVTIENNTLKMTAEQMTTAERDAMLERLRAPYQTTTAVAR